MALRRYGLTEADYLAILASQGGVCAICGTDKEPTGNSLGVDHCHKTGKVRGILCSECNHGLGKLKDSAAIIRRAAEYLENALLPD